MKGTATPVAFFLLAFCSFSRVTCTFPFIYKRGSKTLHEGHMERPNKLNETQLRSTLSLETWDLLPLLPICNPYYKLVLVT